MPLLEGKVAVVTGGGGSGIGHGISLVLAKHGAHVAILELDLDAAEEVSHQIETSGGHATAIRADISRSDNVRRAIDMVIEERKRLDILVNNAGIGLIRPVAEASEEEFDRLAAIDLRGMWLCCKYAIPHMRRQKQGSIVNIASVHTRATLPQFGLYAAIKAGVAGLSRGIAVQYGPDGIRANTVSPGLVDGKQTRDIVAQLSNDVEGYFNDFVRCEQTLPTLIQPEDIGNLVAFLASDDARMITGVEIPVDAGMWVQLSSRR
ncbi:MAG TPA: SDR family NAD(P)-dependent oxidoreductase [Terriglobia bacterium]|nr:SDR family NAD(P)-dependent oxidoreductase [Terriglobia bacterium]